MNSTNTQQNQRSEPSSSPNFSGALRPSASLPGSLAASRPAGVPILTRRPTPFDSHRYMRTLWNIPSPPRATSPSGASASAAPTALIQEPPTPQEALQSFTTLVESTEAARAQAAASALIQLTSRSPKHPTILRPATPRPAGWALPRPTLTRRLSRADVDAPSKALDLFRSFQRSRGGFGAHGVMTAILNAPLTVRLLTADLLTDHATNAGPYSIVSKLFMGMKPQDSRRFVQNAFPPALSTLVHTILEPHYDAIDRNHAADRMRARASPNATPAPGPDGTIVPQGLEDFVGSVLQEIRRIYELINPVPHLMDIIVLCVYVLVIRKYGTFGGLLLTVAISKTTGFPAGIRKSFEAVSTWLSCTLFNKITNAEDIIAISPTAFMTERWEHDPTTGQDITIYESLVLEADRKLNASSTDDDSDLEPPPAPEEGAPPPPPKPPIHPQGSAGVKGVASAAIIYYLTRRMSYVSRVVNLGKLHTGLALLWDGSANAAGHIADAFLGLLNKEKIFTVHKEQELVEVLSKAADRLNSEARTRPGGPSAEHAQTLNHLMVRIAHEKPKWKTPTDEFRRLDRANNVLLALRAKFGAVFSCTGTRVQPTGLLLSGLAGVGKSIVLGLISEAVHRHSYPDATEEDINTRSAYHLATNSEYFEGYHGQTTTILDDFLQMKPVAGSAKEVENAIKMVNSSPCALNMAALEMKGEVWFNSDYVMGTTNFADRAVLDKVMSSVAALERRFPFIYDLRLAPGVPNPEDPNSPFTPMDERWQFRPTSLGLTPDASVPHLNLTQVLRLVIAKREHSRAQHTDFHDQTKAFLASFFAAPPAQAAPPPDIAIPAIVPEGAMLSTGTSAILSAARHPLRLIKRIPKPVKIGLLVGGGFLFARASARRLGSKLGEAGQHALKLGAISVIALSAIAVLVRKLFGLIGRVFGPRRKANIVPQGIAGPHPDEFIAKVQKAILPIKTDGGHLGYGIALTDTLVRICNHYRHDRLGNPRRLFFDHVLCGLPHRTYLEHLVDFDELTDTAIYRVPKTGSKDITASILSPGPKFPGTAWLVYPDRAYPVSLLGGTELVRYPNHVDGACSNRRVGRHSATFTNAGDCGAVLVDQALGRQRIIGYHTAFDTSAPLMAGLFIAASAPPAPCPIGPQAAEQWAGRNVIRHVKPIFNPIDPKLVPAPTHGLFGPPAKVPVNMATFAGVPALRSAVAKLPADDYWDDIDPADEARFLEILDHVIGDTMSDPAHHDHAPVTLEQAIFGDPELGIGPLATNKSTGYPLIYDHPNRKDLWDPIARTISPKLRALVEETLADIEAGGDPEVVYRDFLKAETRAPGKEARLIRGSPLVFTIIVRMQFMSFISAFARGRMRHGMVLGLNPFGLEATIIHQRLIDLSNNVSDGDYHKFDKNHRGTWLRAIVNGIASRSPKLNPKVTKWIAKNTGSAKAVGGDDRLSDMIYDNDGTTPTGHGLTTILNMFFNKCLAAFAWVTINGNDLAALATFETENTAEYYGDDFRLASRGDRLTVGTMQGPVAKLKYRMTDSDGVFPGRPLTPIDQSTFLARRDIVSPSGRVFMAINEDVICDMFNWKKRSTPDLVFLEGVCNSALLELGGYNYDRYLHFAGPIHGVVKEHSLAIPFTHPDATSYAYWRRRHCCHSPEWELEGI